MRKANKTQKDVWAIFKEHEGHVLMHKQVMRLLIEKGSPHHQQQISSYTKKFLVEGKIVKVSQRTKSSRYFYGIPNIREDGTKYLLNGETEIEVK